MSKKSTETTASTYVTRHLQFAWWSLVCFLTLGIALELMHALKIGWYLDEGHSARRLMWTLAHAHGTLLALVHAAYAFTLTQAPAALESSARTVSLALIAFWAVVFLAWWLS